MKILRWIWFISGVCVTLRFGWFFISEIGYAFSFCGEPDVPTFWLIAAYSGAMILSLDMDIKNLSQLVGEGGE